MFVEILSYLSPFLIKASSLINLKSTGENDQGIATSPMFFVKGMEKMHCRYTNFIQFLALTPALVQSCCCFDLKNMYVCIFLSTLSFASPLF